MKLEDAMRSGVAYLRVPSIGHQSRSQSLASLHEIINTWLWEAQMARCFLDGSDCGSPKSSHPLCFTRRLPLF
jgi:hypothetical protein